MENEFGKSFRGTIIRDPLIEPYVIGHYDTGGYVVAEKKSVNEKERVALLGYPSTLSGCLEMIAKNKVNVSGKEYDSLKSYIDEYREVIGQIKKVVEI